MRHTILASIAIVLATVSILAGARAEAPKADPRERAAIERAIRDYLFAHPEILEEALQILEARREAEARARARAAIRENRDALLAHSMSPVSGNPDGDVTVVEFFDYRCGFCKRALPTMKNLLKTDAKVRVVWKEFPILGPVSRFAARASAAAARQGRFYPFHAGLMGAPGQLTEDRVLEIAAATGLDVERLRRDMKDPAIEAYLDETRELAQTIGIRGTPAFVIGGELVRGAVDSARMEQLVARARDGG